MIWAAEHGHLTTVRYLLSRGADTNIRDNVRKLSNGNKSIFRNMSMCFSLSIRMKALLAFRSTTKSFADLPKIFTYVFF